LQAFQKLHGPAGAAKEAALNKKKWHEEERFNLRTKNLRTWMSLTLEHYNES
jgi:hypothetical protein